MKKISIPRPVKWKLEPNTREVINIELTKDEVYLIRQNLKMMWKAGRDIFDIIGVLQPISSRLHLDYIAIIQGDNEVLLCKTGKHFK